MCRLFGRFGFYRIFCLLLLASIMHHLIFISKRDETRANDIEFCLGRVRFPLFHSLRHSFAPSYSFYSQIYCEIHEHQNVCAYGDPKKRK